VVIVLTTAFCAGSISDTVALSELVTQTLLAKTVTQSGPVPTTILATTVLL